MENYFEAEPSPPEKDGSYFAAYKTKMKKFKAAGLQANAQMMNSIHPNMAFRNSLTNETDQKYIKDVLINKKGFQAKTERGSNTDYLEPLQTGLLSTSPIADEVDSPTSMTGNLSILQMAIKLTICLVNRQLIRPSRSIDKKFKCIREHFLNSILVIY